MVDAIEPAAQATSPVAASAAMADDGAVGDENGVTSYGACTLTVTRRGTLMVAANGEPVSPFDARTARLACRGWFAPVSYDFLARMRMEDALRVLGAVEVYEQRSLSTQELFVRIERAFESGEMVAFLGTAQEPRQASSGAGPLVETPAPPPPAPAPDPVPLPPTLHTCRWQDCPGEHEEDINPTYPNNGVLVHGKDSQQVAYADA